MGKAIGIDLGTTNTVISYVNKNGKLRQLRYDNKETIIPSVIYFKSRNEYYIGSTAKKMLELNPAAGVRNFKTRMGDSEKYEITPEEGKPFSLRSREIAKLFLNKLIGGMEEKLLKEFGSVEGFIEKAIITVPAKYSSTQKGETRRAAKEAGLDSINLAAEPTAAAIAYEDSRGSSDPNAVILVYDFGGGTFDVSIIRRHGNSFEEIATGGDKNLGGNTLTEKLVEEILEHINDDYGLDMPLNEDDFDEETQNISPDTYRLNMSDIYNTANLIKERLSEEEDVTEFCNLVLPDGQSIVYEAKFTRAELEDFIRDYIEETIKITKQTIREAKDKGVEEIDQIVLAGGSSNIPLVKESLEKYLQNHAVVFGDDVSTMISRGAVQLGEKADQITSKTLTNVDMGIAAREGLRFAKFQTIIPANEPLPCTRKALFQLENNNQQSINIAYYERDVKNYPHATRIIDDGIEQIDTIVIDNLPPGLRADDTDVEVEFTAQADGSLDIFVVLMDRKGVKLKQSDKISFNKKSDLE